MLYTFLRKVDTKSTDMFKKFNQKSKGEHQKHLCNHDWVDRVRKWSDVDLVFHYSSSWPHERNGSFGFKSTAVPPWPMIPTVDVIPGDDGLLGLWGGSPFLHLKILVLISGPSTNPFARRRLTSSRWTRNSARKIGPAQVRPDPFHDLQNKWGLLVTNSILFCRMIKKCVTTNTHTIEVCISGLLRVSLPLPCLWKSFCVEVNWLNFQLEHVVPGTCLFLFLILVLLVVVGTFWPSKPKPP